MGKPVRHPVFDIHRKFVNLDNESWHLKMLEIEKIREITTGKGGRVAVIDSGIDEFHPEIFGKVVIKMDRTGEGFRGGDHGTFVAGEMAGNNLGLFPDLEIGDYKALTALEGVGDAAWVSHCVYDALTDGFTVASASLGSDYPDPMMELAIKTFTADGKKFFVAASGNDGTKDEKKFTTDYPAAFNIPGLISVGAVGLDKAGHLYIPIWSSKGKVTLVAPGVEILGILPGKQYGILSGTSMATPLVAATIAAAKTIDPDFGHAKFDAIIQMACKDIASKGFDASSGAGVIQVVDFLKAVEEMKSKPLIDTPLVVKASFCQKVKTWFGNKFQKKEEVNQITLNHDGKEVRYVSKTARK